MKSKTKIKRHYSSGKFKNNLFQAIVYIVYHSTEAKAVSCKMSAFTPEVIDIHSKLAYVIVK